MTQSKDIIGLNGSHLAGILQVKIYAVAGDLP